MHAVCDAKHISKSNYTKRTIVGPLLEVKMSKKCTSLWREAHFQVKMCKTLGVRTTFGDSDVEKVHVVVTREIHFQVKIDKKELGVQTTFENYNVEKVRVVVTRTTFQNQKLQNTRVRTTFGCSDVVLRGRRKGSKLRKR